MFAHSDKLLLLILEIFLLKKGNIEPLIIIGKQISTDKQQIKHIILDFISFYIFAIYFTFIYSACIIKTQNYLKNFLKRMLFQKIF